MKFVLAVILSSGLIFAGSKKQSQHPTQVVVVINQFVGEMDFPDLRTAEGEAPLLAYLIMEFEGYPQDLIEEAIHWNLFFFRNANGELVPVP